VWPGAVPGHYTSEGTNVLGLFALASGTHVELDTKPFSALKNFTVP
jgi:hypothetical protein